MMLEEPEITYLCQRPEFSEIAAEWIFHEFLQPLGSTFTYEHTRDFFKVCYENKLPIRLVAFLNGKCVGTVSVVENDLAGSSYTPWLSALYVDKHYRNLRIGKKLIESAKKVARALGYKELYLRTERAGDYYKKLGWSFVEERDDDYGLRPTVFKTGL